MKHHLLSAPYIMWVVILFGVAINFALWPYEFVYQTSSLSFVLFALAFLYWVYFFIKATAKNLQAPHRPYHITQLVTTGVYKWVRHPMYSADIVLAWGIAVAYPLAALWMSALWLTIIMTIWAYVEENILLKRFSEEYGLYRRHTPMFFPLKKKK